MDAGQKSEIRKRIEMAWLSRADTQHLNPKSMAYKRAEIEFFVGAMAALDVAFPNVDPTKSSEAVPPIWVINIMSGRPVAERT